MPISPAAEATYGIAIHDTTTALDGAGSSGAMVVPTDEAHPAEAPKADESTGRDEEVEEIEELEKRVESMERQLES